MKFTKKCTQKIKCHVKNIAWFSMIILISILGIQGTCVSFDLHATKAYLAKNTIKAYPHDCNKKTKS